MAGSHEVRGSIPLGSTTDPRGARRRRRAPLFCFLAYGIDRPIGRKARLIRGRRRGPAPLSRSPGLAGPVQAPGRKRASSSPMGIVKPGRAPAPRARRPRRTRSGASGRSATGRGRVRRSAAPAPPSSKGPIGPRKKAARRRRKSRRRNRGGSRFGGGELASPGIGGLPEALDVRRPLSRRGGPCDDAAIEPASRAPKKGLAHRRPPAGLGRPRRGPDPCVRRRGGAAARSARCRMGPAGFGNAGLSPRKTLGWLSRIRRRLGRAPLPGDLGGAVAVGAAAPDL